jgi:3-oxoacyl-[acyl-carrier-protein] synthase-1
MERIALQRAGLENRPISALKPIFGHTMGAAGVVETIIGTGLLLHGTFIKMLSGFGGVNAAIRITCK